MRSRRLTSQAIRYVLAAVALAFFLLHISWICLTAFKTGDWIYKTPLVWLAPDPTLLHFELFIESGGLKALANSIIITTSATALALLIGSLAAYGLARDRVGGTNLPFFILSQRFMPPAVIVFPFLMILKMLKWVDIYQALTVIYLTFNLPYAMWMMRASSWRSLLRCRSRRCRTDVRPLGLSGASPCRWLHLGWRLQTCSASSLPGPSSSLRSV